MNQIKRAINHKLIIALLFVLTAFTISAQNEPDILGPVEVYAGEAASYTFSEPTNTYFPGGWESDGELLIEENQYTGYLSSMDVVWHTTGPHVIDITYLDSSGSIVDYVTLDVQVLYQPAPTPPAPRVISNTNGTVTLGWALGASPPQDVEWHWQSASDGETRTTTSSNSTIGLTSSGTYYLRAYNTQTYDWSDSSSSISFVVASPPKWYYDSDGDGFGNTAPSIESWTQPSGYVDNNFDFCPSEYGLYSGCPDENNENYVRSITYQNPYSEADLGNTIPFEDKIETITYLDGLGRAKQNINIRAGGNSEDIITHIEYDAYGRQDKEYLPYPLEAGGGLFRTDAKTATETFYYAPKYENTSNPFSEKSLETSPLNRVIEQGAPGADWAVNKNSDSDHTIKFEYTTNKTEDYVKNYGVSFQPNYPYDPEDPDLDDRYIYSENELYKTITKDENWQPGQTYPNDHTTEEYKDKEGRVVLKRTFNKNKWHDTYYVYDEHGNLTYVLPPQVSTYRLLTQQNWAGQNFSFSNNPNLFTGAPPYNSISFYFLPNGNLKIYVYTSGSAGIGLKDGLALNLDFLSPTLPDMNLGDFTDYYNGDNFGSAYIQGGNLYFDSTGFVTTSYTEVDLGLEVDLSNYQTSFVPPPIDQVQLDDLAYQYKYDKRNRLIEKKIPGKDKEEIVYNKLDQPVFTRDANLKSDGKWLFTKYDAHGRVVYTGVISSNKERGDLQGDMDGVLTLFETKTGANNIAGTTVYYSNNALPSSVSISEVYTINYYDNYTFDGFTVMPQTVYGQSVVNYNNASNTRILTKGLATGSKVKVLASSSHWITTINGYDEKGRGIYTKSENPYLQTIDIVESKLDFTGKVIESKTNHERAAYVATDIETIDNYEYDHAGRLISQKQNINNQGEELIVKNHYDELGQLVKKGVGNVEASPLQELDYTYNIRGWLKTINDPFDVSQNGDLFRFGINYNDSQLSSDNSYTPLFNGNISDTYWKTENIDSGIKEYSYNYDALNRFISATFYKGGAYSGQFNENINGYDRNGNILGLSRRMKNPNNSNYSANMDILYYAYKGNQLTSVNEVSWLANTATGQLGFKDGNTVGDDYDYDDNGNMIEDKNKGITSITYNHLNLPTLINVDDGGGNVGTISYIYDATGIKLTKMTSNGSKTIYAGNYIYEDGVLKYFSHPEGYVDAENGYEYVYQYKDHLGNVRLSYADSDGDGEVIGASSPVFTDDLENTSGWNSVGALYGSTATVDNARALSGNSSAKLHLAASGTKYAHSNLWFTINNTQPTEYIFSGWVYVEATGNHSNSWARLVFFMNEDSETSYFTEVSHTPELYTKNQWVYMEKKVTVPANIDEINLRIGICGWGSTNPVVTGWFDNLSIRKVNAPSDVEIVEENNYYPFGLKHKGYNNNPITNHKYELYNGVELEESLGLNLYEMDLRSYDPAIGRFNGIDPVIHYDFSPYQAFDNNPAFWADPTGADSIYNWETGQYVINGQVVSQDEAIAYAKNGGNADGSNNNTPDDDITVNSEGIVTKIVKNDKPHRFFDEEGNELSFNDPDNDFSLFNNWNVGDRLFFQVSNKELGNAILQAGLRRKNKWVYYNIGLSYLLTAWDSHGKADFTFSYLVPKYFTQSEKNYLEEGIFRTTYNSYQHFFRFGNTNEIYNLYDAGNYMWGSWMRLNGYQSWEIKMGSQANELRKFGTDSAADQRAIGNGFNHFNFLLND